MMVGPRAPLLRSWRPRTRLSLVSFPRLLRVPALFSVLLLISAAGLVLPSHGLVLPRALSSKAQPVTKAVGGFALKPALMRDRCRSVPLTRNASFKTCMRAASGGSLGDLSDDSDRENYKVGGGEKEDVDNVDTATAINNATDEEEEDKKSEASATEAVVENREEIETIEVEAVEAYPVDRRGPSSVSNSGSILRERAQAYAANLHLSALLGQLDDRQVRYRPTASRSELESMLADALVEERTVQDDEGGRNGNSRRVVIEGINDDIVGIGGDGRRIRRQRRNDKEQGGSRRVVVEGVNDDPAGFGDSSRRDRRNSQRRRRRRGRQSQAPHYSSQPSGGWKSAMRDAASVTSRAVEPVDRAVSSTLWGVGRGMCNIGLGARRVADSVANGDIGKRMGRSRRVLRIGEDGIAEPEWTYVSRDDEDYDSDDGKATSHGYDYSRGQVENGIRKGVDLAKGKDAETIRDESDDFTWADYAIPFWTPAGSPRRNKRKKRSQKRNEMPLNDRTTRERPLRPPNVNGTGEPIRPPPGRPRRRRRMNDRRPDGPIRGENFSSPPQHPVRPPGTYPRKREPLILPPVSVDVAPFPPGAASEEGSGAEEGGRKFRQASSAGNDTNVDDNWRQRPRDRPRSKTRGSRRRSSNRSDRAADGRERPIYSVWSDHDENDSFVDGDFIDMVGNRVADAAENFLWGNEEDREEHGGTSGPEPRGNRDGRGARRRRRSAEEGPSSRSDRTSTRPEKRHWRDRLADRLDSAMGVHEEGSYYRSWQDKIDLEEATKVGDEPIDWVMARHKNQRRLGLTPDERRVQREQYRRSKSVGQARRPSKSGAPLWTGENDLMSLLLGKKLTGEKLREQLFKEPLGVNFCTTILRSSLQATLTLFTNTCRWATVRGALPQPVVVFFVGAAAVSAPRGRRLVAVGATLLVLRTIAEALHGYIYGDEDWADDHDQLYHDADPGWEGNDGAAASSSSSSGSERESSLRPPPRRRRRRNKFEYNHDYEEGHHISEDWDGDGL